MSAYLRSASSALEVLRPMQGHSAPPATSTTHQLAAQPRQVRLSLRKRSTDVEKAAHQFCRFATTGCQSKKGIRGRGGRLRTRDLQMRTSPCAPENCLAAPRSAHLLTKSLVYKQQLAYTKQGEGGGELKTQDTRERRRKKQDTDDAATPTHGTTATTNY